MTDYNDFMSGVDSNDKSIALWTVSLKSLRFYLRIFYWQFDGIINAMWILVCHTLSEMNESERKIIGDNSRPKIAVDMTLRCPSVYH